MTARHARIVALVFAFLLVATVFAPQIPPVREWLLGQARDAVAAQGYQVAYDRSAGNPWRGIRLFGARISGPGVDVRVETLRVGYFLPSLLASELPLTIDVAGIRGDVDFDALPSTGGVAAEPPIRPVFEEVVVRDVDLVIGNAPFTLPDLTLTDLAFEQVDGRFAFDVDASTANGSVSATGLIGVGPFTLEAQVERADLTLTRQWWSGVTGGTGRGTVSVDENGIRADLQVTDGALSWIGLEGEDISGPIRYRHPVVDGDLMGTVLGGAARARASVNVAGRTWQGTMTGAGGVPEVAAWITRNMTFDPEVLALTGDATYDLAAAGWRTVTLEGEANGQGTVLDQPFSGVEASIRYTTGDGVRVDATTALARGNATVAVAQSGAGLRVRAGAAGMTIGPAHVPSADLDLTFTADGPRGGGTVALAGTVLDRSSSLAVDLVADPEGLQFFAEGNLGPATLTGAALLDGADIEGGARLAALDLPGLAGSPVIEASWSGAWSDLTVEVSLASSEPVRASLAGVDVDADLRGRATGTLRDLREFDLSGAFGPVGMSASGTPAAGRVELSVDQVPVTGAVVTNATVPAARLTYGSPDAGFTGRLVHEAVEVSGMTLEAAAWTFGGSLSSPDASGPTLRARTDDGSAAVAWQPPRLSATFDGLVVSTADRTAAVAGDASLAPSAGLPSIRADLVATVPEGEISLQVTDDLRLRAALPAGFSAGRVALAEPLVLAGTLDADARGVDLTGSIGSVQLGVRGALEPSPRAQVEIQSGAERLDVTVGAEAGITAQGRLELGPVAAVFGLEAAGTVTADLGVQDGAYTGSARIDAAAPVPFQATLVGAGNTVAATVEASAAGLDLQLTGPVVPSVLLRGSIGPLEGIEIAGTDLGGAGEFPRFAFGPVTVPAQPWTVIGGIAAGSAQLVVGESRLVARWDEGWRVSADIRQPVSIGDRTARIDASASIGAALPAGQVTGTVTGTGDGWDGDPPNGPRLADFEGSLNALAFSVDGPASTVLDFFTNADLVAGIVTVAGEVAPRTGAIEAAGQWRAGGPENGATAIIAVSRPAGAPLQASLAHGGLSVAWDAGELIVEGSAADVAPFLSEFAKDALGIERLEVDGRLALADGRWNGALDVQTDIPNTTLTLAGTDGMLTGDLQAQFAGGDLRAAGPVLPELDLAIRADVGPLSATGTVAGPFADARLSAVASVAPVDAGPVALAPVAFDVAGTLAPLALDLSGPGIDAVVTGAGPAGTVALSGTVAGLSETVALDLGGTLARPTVAAELAGPVTGSVGGGMDGLRGTLGLAPVLFPEAAALTGPATVDVLAALDLSWQADARAESHVAGEPIAVSVSVSGEGAKYRGQGRISSATGVLAGLSIEGDAAEATVGIDLGALERGALDPLLAVTHDLTGTGSLELNTAPFAVQGSVGLTGTVAGMVVEVAASLPDDGGIEVDAAVGPATLSLQSGDARTIAYVAAYEGTPAAAVAGDVTLRVDLGTQSESIGDGTGVRGLAGIANPASIRGFDLTGAGTLAGSPLSVSSMFDRGTPADPADAPADARFELTVHSEPAGLELSLARSPGSDEWAVRANLRSDAGPVPATASLQGRAAATGPDGPVVTLGGEVRVPVWDLLLDADLSADQNAARVAVQHGGLVLAAAVGFGAADTFEASLRGAGTLDVSGSVIEISAGDGLRWSPGSGFAGTAEAEILLAALEPVLNGPVTASMQGARGLNVAFATPAGLVSGEMATTEVPWSDPGVTGTIQIDVPPGGLAGRRDPMVPGLTGTVALSGTLTEPVLKGPVELVGPVEAVGRLQYADGSGRLRLAGDDLDLLALAGTDGWTVEATLASVPVAVLPLADSRVSGRIYAAGVRSRVDAATLTGVRIDTREGSIEAEALLNGGVDLSARFDLPLADVELGPAMVGRVTGPLVVRLPSLDDVSRAELQGALELTEAGVAGVPGRLSGGVGLRGMLGELQGYARLSGTSGATGTLDLDADLGRGMATVDSTLEYAGVQTDLRIDVDRDSWQADGTVRYRDYAVQLAPGGEGIGLTGQLALDGWEGRLDSEALELEFSGPIGTPLQALIPLPVEADGTATLRAGLRPAATASLSVAGLTVAGSDWGRIDVNYAGAANTGATYTDAASVDSVPTVAITGEHVEGAIAWNGEISWRLAVDGLPVLPNVRLTADVEGRGDTAAGSLSATGTYGGAPVSLDARAELAETLTASADGSLLGGTLAASATRDRAERWSGSFEIAEAVASGQTFSAVGTLTGTGALPTLQATTTVSGPVAASGTLTAGTEAVRLEQRLALPGIGTDIVVAGTAWPNVDLVVGTQANPGAETVAETVAETAAETGAETGADTGADTGAETGAGDVTGAEDVLRLTADDWRSPLFASGAAGVTVAGTDVRIHSEPLRLTIDAPFEGLSLTGDLAQPDSSLAGIVASLRDRGITFEGRNRSSGTVTLSPAPPSATMSATLTAILHDFGYEHPSGVTVRASGPLGPAGADVTGTVVLPETELLSSWNVLPVDEPIAFRLRGLDLATPQAGPSGAPLAGYALAFEAQSGTLEATVTSGLRVSGLTADVSVGGGRLAANLAVSPTTGLSGTVTVTDVTVPTVEGAESLVLNGTLTGLGNEVDVSARATVNGSTAQIAGFWTVADLLPTGWLPPGDGRRTLEVRVREFDPTTLPTLAGRVPNLTVPLSGVLQIQPNRVFGRLVSPDLRVLTQELPLSLDITGSFSELTVQGTLGRSTIQITAGAGGIESYMRLERFPAHLGIEALIGETDVSAEVTGVLRASLPAGAGSRPDVRLATERIRLERDEVVTLGNVSIDYLDGELVVRNAVFEGVGVYEASGVIRANELDFSLRADDADFGPLLGLVPSLARLGADARGDITLEARGTLGDPRIAFTATGLEVAIVGGSYRVPAASVNLEGRALSLEGTIEGVSPVAGDLAFAGGGRIVLAPFRLARIDVQVSGAATVPVLGEVRAIDGTLSFGSGEPPTIDVGGQLGNRLSVSGTLAPLNLAIAGDDLAVTSPAFLLASSRLDIDARVVQEQVGDDAAYVVRGGIFADEARFALGIRTLSTRQTEPNPALQRVVFDDVRIQAPRQLNLSENFGTLEGRADLTLSGSAAEPMLMGRAEAVRGNVRFFGREFALLSAEAVFERTRGIYPTVSLRARTSVEKSRVLAGIANEVRFVAPRDTPSFEIDLIIAGEVEPTPNEARAFRLQVEPELSSEALIEVRGESVVASGPRRLLDTELLSVITLGRLEINPQFTGEEGFASAVAGTALDTVVDFLLVSELQRSLSEALGVDVVEIRTTSLSRVFSGDGEDPFSVSLRLGGYLTEDLFASYRIGRFDDASAELGLTNEVRLTYELGPVAFDLAGSVGFDATEASTPIPGLSAAVRYEISPLIDLETSVELSNARSRARFGVTFRW